MTVTVLVPKPIEVLQPYTAERQASIEGGADFILNETDSPTIHDAEVILCAGLSMTAAVLENLPRCQLVANYGIGYDTIDVEAATELGIVVTNTPTYGLTEVSDHAAALILSITRRIPWFDRQVRAGHWSTAQQTIFDVHRLRGMTLGIIGLGNIGREVARKMAVFGFRILAHDSYLTDETIRGLGATPASFEDLLRQSDIVTVHVPLLSTTRYLIDAGALDLMKPTAILVNTSRGPVIDEAALISALQSDRLAAAALDVFEHEPPAIDNPLLAMDPQRVILTPHFAGASVEAVADQQQEVADAIASFLTGEWPRATVNPTVKPKKPLGPQ